MKVKSLSTFGRCSSVAPTAGLLLSAACAGPAPAPTLTPAPPTITLPQPTASATQAATPTITPPASAIPTDTPPSRALRDLQPGQSLSMIAEIRVLQVDFGLRSAFSPVGPILYHTGVGPQIAGDDFQLGETVFQLGGFPRGAPLVLEISPAGDLLVAEDGPTLGVWRLPQGERMASLEMPSIFPPQSGGFLGADALYAADSAGNVVLWDTRTWQERSRLSFPGPIDAAFVLPSGEAIALLGREEMELNLMAWSGEVINTIPLPGTPWRFLGLSPEGGRAVLHLDYGKSTESVVVLTLDDVQPLLTFPMLNIRQLAVSDDWSTLALTDVSETLHLIDPQIGQQYYTQPLEAFRIMGLSLSPDGSLLAVHAASAGSAGGTIQVWGRELP